MLRKADAKIEAAGGELEKEEVEQIINYVCHVSSYHNIELVEWEGKARLAHPHLETWEKRGVAHLQGQVQALVSPSLTEQGMHWAGRVSDHCHYLIGQQRMDAAELYDLWLRAGYRATEEWVKFLCEVNVTATPHPPSSHRVRVCLRTAWRSCQCTPGRQRTASRPLLRGPSSSPRTSDFSDFSFQPTVNVKTNS